MVAVIERKIIFHNQNSLPLGFYSASTDGPSLAIRANFVVPSLPVLHFWYLLPDLAFHLSPSYKLWEDL